MKMGQEELEKQKQDYGDKSAHPKTGKTHHKVDSGECSTVIGFYHEDEEHGCFSNWYPCKFAVDGVTYNSSEQYMMAQKVLLFGRKDLAVQIMATDDPHTEKHIAGQHFPEYDDALWGAKCYETVKKGVKAKFEQNPELKQELLATGNALLCECAPHDKKWGIGIGLDNPDYQHPDRWRGKNYLGFILMEVRAELS